MEEESSTSAVTEIHGVKIDNNPTHQSKLDGLGVFSWKNSYFVKHFQNTIEESSTSAITEIYGVKIDRNPTQSKLDLLGVSSWKKYRCEPGKIPWTFEGEETMYLLEGKVKVSVEGHEGSFEVGGGNLVVFPKGMKITWEVLETVTKHYNLS